jgi:DNA-binding helix-hairpin-helix protein with protein kinase domain
MEDVTLVAKLYHKPTEERGCKLAAMLANPPEDPMLGAGQISIAWPLDLLCSKDSRRVAGFLMPKVVKMRPIIDFYNPKTRHSHCPLFNYLYLHYAAYNLATAIHALHTRGYVIGDVNESNILASDRTFVTLVDTDSFQVPGEHGILYRCPVGKPEFTPPELQGKSFATIDRRPEHDNFGLAVLIFQLLMEGVHPFAGVFQGKGDPPLYERRISQGHFVYSRRKSVPYKPMPLAPPLVVLAPALQKLFLRCFEEGHQKPSVRPSALMWKEALNQARASMVTCRVNSQHRYGRHLRICPWCRQLKQSNRDPFPSKEAVRLQRSQAAVSQKTVSRPARPVEKAYVRPAQLPSRVPPAPIPAWAQYVLTIAMVFFAWCLVVFIGWNTGSKDDTSRWVKQRRREDETMRHIRESVDRWQEAERIRQQTEQHRKLLEEMERSRKLWETEEEHRKFLERINRQMEEARKSDENLKVWRRQVQEYVWPSPRKLGIQKDATDDSLLHPSSTDATDDSMDTTDDGRPHSSSSEK